MSRFYVLTKFNEVDPITGFRIKDGLNMYPIREDHRPVLFFFNEAQLLNYYQYISNPVWIRIVEEFPDNMVFAQYEGYTLASSLVLGPREKFNPRQITKYVDIDDDNVMATAYNLNKRIVNYY